MYWWTDHRSCQNGQVCTSTKLNLLIGVVKADQYRRLVPPLSDGQEHGLSHVQVRWKLTSKMKGCEDDNEDNFVSLKFCRDFLDQLADKMSPWDSSCVGSNPSQTPHSPYFIPSLSSAHSFLIVHPYGKSRNSAGYFRWIKCLAINAKIR